MFHVTKCNDVTARQRQRQRQILTIPLPLSFGLSAPVLKKVQIDVDCVCVPFTFTPVSASKTKIDLVLNLCSGRGFYRIPHSRDRLLCVAFVEIILPKLPSKIRLRISTKKLKGYRRVWFNWTHWGSVYGWSMSWRVCWQGMMAYRAMDRILGTLSPKEGENLVYIKITKA